MAAFLPRHDFAKPPKQRQTSFFFPKKLARLPGVGKRRRSPIRLAIKVGLWSKLVTHYHDWFGHVAGLSQKLVDRAAAVPR